MDVLNSLGIGLTNQGDLGSVEEANRRCASVKPKNKEASKLLTPQNFKQNFQIYKVKVHSNNIKSQEN